MFVLYHTIQCRQLCARTINSSVNTHAGDSCYITAAVLQAVLNQSVMIKAVRLRMRREQKNIFFIKKLEIKTLAAPAAAANCF